MAFPFTVGQVLTAAEMNAIVILSGVGSALLGSPPTGSAGGFIIQAGFSNVTFSSGAGTLTFPNSFPNGVLTVVGNVNSSGNSDVLTFAGNTTAQITVGMFRNNSGFTGSVPIQYIAIGF